MVQWPQQTLMRALTCWRDTADHSGARPNEASRFGGFGVFGDGLGIPSCAAVFNRVELRHIVAASRLHELLDYRLTHVVDANTLDEDGWPPLFFACRNGDLDRVRSLVEGGAELNGRAGHDGSSALIISAGANQTHVVNMLLDAGADIHQRQTGGLARSPLDAACSAGGDMLSVLLTRGAAPDARDAEGRTALFSAMTARKPDSLVMLVQLDGGRDAVNNLGWTPLMTAIWMGSRDVTRWLVDQGADLKVKDQEWRNALHYAKRLDASAARVHLAISGRTMEVDGRSVCVARCH